MMSRLFQRTTFPNGCFVDRNIKLPTIHNDLLGREVDAYSPDWPDRGTNDHASTFLSQPQGD